MCQIDSFYDRRRHLVIPSIHSTIKNRRGAFALVVDRSAHHGLLVREVLDLEIPQLPGSGIEAEETAEATIKREWEEVGLPLLVSQPLKRFQQLRGFSAGDDEFWIYDQIFLLYRFYLKIEAPQSWPNREKSIAA